MGIQKIIAIVSFFLIAEANAFDLFGTVNWNQSKQSTAGSNYKKGDSGIGYLFGGRLGVPFVPFLYVESGFSVFPVGMTIGSAVGDVVVSGSYWSVPVLLRVMPISYISAGVGLDYAVVGSSKLELGGSPLSNSALTTGYKSHFGAVASVIGQYPILEMLSLIVDVRYRMGLETALNFEGTNRKLNVLSFGVGVSKSLF